MEEILKRVILAAAGSLLLYGCSSTPSLKDASASLTVYPDNRIGYVLSSRRELGGTRVWSSENQVLALRFRGRLINAKDIDSVVATEIRKSREQLNIAVALKSGEVLAADVVDWGYGVEWVACTTTKVCEFLERSPSTVRHLSFPSFPALLSVATEQAVTAAARRDDIGQPGMLAKSVVSYDLDDAMGYSRGSYEMKFQSVDQVADIKGAIEKERARQLVKAQCVSEKVRRREQELQAEEKEIRRRAPPSKENEWVESWRLNNSASFWRSQAELACS